MKLDKLIICSLYYVFGLSFVTSDQICAPIIGNDVQGDCPADTCCDQTICTNEASKYKCCETPNSISCSNCPKCINCQWEEWSSCSADKNLCGDGLKPQRVRGEKTRKHITQTDGDGNQVVTGPGGQCPGTIINGTEYATKAPCDLDCPDFCTDGIQNYGEDDVDCGGPNCPKCTHCNQACVIGWSCLGVFGGIFGVGVGAAYKKRDTIKDWRRRRNGSREVPTNEHKLEKIEDT